MSPLAGAVAPLAVADRSGFDESIHHGAAVALAADGSVIAAVGEPTVRVYPRSCLKPLQADAMIALGLDLPDELLAVACASHDGAAVHLDAVRSILASGGLDESALQNTPSHSLCDHHGRDGASSLRQNCSGKHAAMLVTCVVNGWPLSTYLDQDHPLQQAITAHFAALGCPAHHVGVDGCGAPTHVLALDELARTVGRLAAADSPVARAMRAHPVLVGGADRDVTGWMQAVPGSVAKEGAAGVMVLALDDGRAAAYKVADGSDAARRAVVPAALRALGVDLDRAALERFGVPVLGHGRPVGRLEPLEWRAWSS